MKAGKQIWMTVFGLLLGLSFCMTTKAEEQDNTEEVITDYLEWNPTNPDYLEIQSDNVYSDKLEAAMSKEDFAKFEKVLVKAMKNFQEELDVTSYGISDADIDAYMEKIRDKHDELWYVTGTGWSSWNRVTRKVRFYYKEGMNKERVAVMEAEVNAVVEEALECVTPTMRDYEKALAIHDWLALHCKYGRIPDDSGDEYNVYGALVKGMAVCSGYAKAYQYLLQEKLGIPCEYVSSSDMNHAWNMVKIGSKYYHVDVTWDDSSYVGGVNHWCFLQSDTGIKSKSHYGWTSTKKATDTKYNDAFWNKVNTPFVYHNKNWYYTMYSSAFHQNVMYKSANVVTDNSEMLFVIENQAKGTQNIWYSEGYISCPQLFREGIVVNSQREVYYMPFATQKAEIVFTPPEIKNNLNGYNILGFQMNGAKMYYQLATNTGTILETKEADFPNSQISGKATIEGTAICGNTLTAEATITGNPGALHYQWYRGKTRIPGAIAKTYKPVSKDAGKVLKVHITCNHFSGELIAETTPVTKLKKGTAFTDAKTQNKYKITKLTSTAVEVAFNGTANKKQKSIVIPAMVKCAGKTFKVTSIAKSALKNHKNVQAVTIGTNVVKIDAAAFYHCKQLKTIAIKSTKLKTLGKDCIKGVYSKATITCPKSKRNAYKKMFTKKTGYQKKIKVK